MTAEDLELRHRELIRSAVVRLRSRVMALVFAMVGGAGLCVATVWLVLQGGWDVGEHLGLLSNYFPGYRVTWGGAALGFLYGALTGGVTGWTLAWVYNRVADWRRPAE